MNKKGTLIFLFILIILFGGYLVLQYFIIPMFAIKTVQNNVDLVKQKAAQKSSYGLINQIRLDYTEAQLMNDSPIMEGDIKNIRVSGIKPTSGTYKISSKTENTTTDIIIELIDVVIDGYTCNGNDKDGVICR